MKKSPKKEDKVIWETDKESQATSLADFGEQKTDLESVDKTRNSQSNKQEANVNNSEGISGALIDSEVASIRLEEAQRSAEPKKKKKNAVWNLVFLGINIAFLIIVLRGLLKDNSFVSFGEALAAQGTKLYWLFGALFCFISIYLCSAVSLSILVKNTTGKSKFWLCLKCAVLGKYYDFITPMAVGGQPSQILNLVKGGVTPGVATSIPIIKMIIQQIVRCVLVIVLYIFLVPQIPSGSGLMDLLFTILKIVGVVGIIATIISCFSFLFLGSSKLVGRTIARWGISIGYKLHIIKNYRASYDKFMRQVIEYQSSMRYLAQNKGVLVQQILWAALEFIFYSSMSFFVCMAFSTEVSLTSFGMFIAIWAIAMARYQVVDMCSTIIILPGGTGVKEVAFLIMFSSFFKTSSAVAWPFLTWRIFDYYLFLAVGFVLIITRMIISAVKNSRQKRLNNGEKAPKIEQDIVSSEQAQ